jgi:N-acetylneuraminate epimerase
MEVVNTRRANMGAWFQHRVMFILIVSMLTLVVVGCKKQPETAGLWNTPKLNWQTLPPLPDEHGFAGGYSGTLNRNGISYLMFAGGANFPDGFPWEGGEKQWYDGIFLSDGVTDWEKIGKLPTAAAYGLTVSHNGSVYLIGGNHQGAKAFSAVYKLTLAENGLQVLTLPPFPQATYNHCGAIIGETLYVAGGSDGEESFSSFWSLNVTRPQEGWQKLPTWPGPSRMLATAGVLNDEFYLVGVAELVSSKDTVQRRYLRDAYAYSENKGWRRLADMPDVRSASPTPAISLVKSQQLIVLAGSDGSLDGQMNDLHINHPGIPAENFIYDVHSDQWQLHSVMPKLRGHLTPTGRDGIWPPVTTNTVLWRGGIAIPSGEIKPGVRSPKVLFTTLTD